MTPALDARSAARILDLAESHGSRSGAIIGFSAILLFAAHAAAPGGSPASAQAAAKFPAGAKIQAGESPHMKRLMAIGAAAIATAGASAQDAVQWRVEDGGNGHWYAVSIERLSFDESASAALLRGGHLAEVESSAENQFCFALAAGELEAWYLPSSGYGQGPYLGSRRNSDGEWVHLSGGVMNFAAWCAGQPDNFGGLQSAATYWAPSGEPSDCWDDVSPLFENSAVIEWSADCNSDGIVDFGQIRAGELADANANNIPDCCESGTPCDCPGDTNSDGSVDGIDLATILTRWAQSAAKFPNADCNRDGVIDGSDLAIVLGAWGGCP